VNIEGDGVTMRAAPPAGAPDCRIVFLQGSPPASQLASHQRAAEKDATRRKANAEA
jgi:hypothetical protein